MHPEGLLKVSLTSLCLRPVPVAVTPASCWPDPFKLVGERAQSPLEEAESPCLTGSFPQCCLLPPLTLTSGKRASEGMCEGEGVCG